MGTSECGGFVLPAGISTLCGQPCRMGVAACTQRMSHATGACVRRKRVAHVRCSAESPSQKTEEDEEVLDEAAMRAAEIHEVLSGLEDFKSRIIDDATKLAKKVRAPKKQLEAALAQHPDIIKIDGHIAQLQEELKQLGDR